MSEWINHDGEGMPVDGDTLVKYRLRHEADFSADDLEVQTPTLASRLDWIDGGKAYDIIAYRVVPDQAASHEQEDQP